MRLTSKRSLSLLFWAIFVGARLCRAAVSKGAIIALQAKWQATPFILEAAEYLADENSELFWRLIEKWPSAEGPGKTCWESLQTVARDLLSDDEAKVLQVVLGIRWYSARLQMFRSLSSQLQAPQGACCIAAVGSQLATNAQQLQAILDGLTGPDTSLEVYAFDHVYGAGKAGAPGAVHVILYGAVGTRCFGAMHDILTSRASSTPAGKPEVVYVLRPLLLEGCGEAELGPGSCLFLGAGGLLSLPGYGVEMAIKNMEYSALDDSKVKEESGAGEGAGGEEQGPLEVGGFLFKRLMERRPDKAQDLLTFRDHLLASSSQEEALKVWDLKDMGLQATQRIVQSSDPLRMLTEISQNFPNMASSLSRLVVSKELRREVGRTQSAFFAGGNLILVNGRTLDTDSLDLFTIVETIRSEVRVSSILAGTKLQGRDVKALLLLRGSTAEDAEAKPRVDITSETDVFWANDLEKDKVYKGWSSSLSTILRPTFPGQFPRIRLNLYNSIFLMDPGKVEAVFMGATAYEFCSRAWPMRMGAILLPLKALSRIKDADSVLPAWEELSVGEKASLLFLYLYEIDPLHAFKLFAATAEQAIPATGVIAEGDLVKWEHYKAGFTAVWKALPASQQRSLAVSEALQQVATSESLRQRLVESILFARQRGVASVGEALWLNGQVLTQEGNWRQVIMYYLQMEMQRVQEWVYTGQLEKEKGKNIVQSVLQLTKAVPRYNPRILQQPGPNDKAGLDTPFQLALGTAGLRPWEAPFSELGYLHHPGTEDAVKAITHWLLLDLDTPRGRKLLLEALKNLAEPTSDSSRLAVIQNPKDADKAPGVWARVVEAALRLPSRRSKIPDFLRSLLQDAEGTPPDGELDLAAALSKAEEAGLNKKALEGFLLDASTFDNLRHQAQASSGALGVRPGATAVVTNGRRYLLYDEEVHVDNPFTAADFELLEQNAIGAKLAVQVRKVVKAALAGGRAKVTAEEGDILEDMGPRALSDAVMLATSVLHPSTDTQVDARAAKLAKGVQRLKGTHSGINLVGALDAIEVTAIVSPLSTPAQRIAPLLQFVHSTLNVSMKVLLNPETDLTDMPLKSYYRYALPDFPLKGGRLGEPGPPVARFEGLPSSKVLTLNMDVPEAWLVEPVAASHDLDNLRLEDLGPNRRYLEALFELEALMITGQCMDVAAKSREQVNPRGVQLWLGSKEQHHMVDTLVMSNLGYFQLKADPGLWQLMLAPGRSQQLYTIASASGISGSSRTSASEEVGAEGNEISTPVVVSRLDGKHMFLNLRKRPGFENADVLGEEDSASQPGGTLWGRVTSLLKSGDSQKEVAKTGQLSPEEDPDCIHIFTIASGHMYERLQKLMIVSVLRNTKNRVKFWFIKNYMSPQMKRFVPHMAKAYGFDYQFVTYKWPSWLHKQTEKQRIIWAYKILFLDVLFPLNLKKVIFTDSDQIIRADFSELWNLDLKGAPYAYTPFCDNNKEMDGFRFWKQGFWKDHLQGKPYHISALYVVDLARFRHLAAGDSLRVIYSQLSQDPHSLANLDQDLPNYAQRMVPIFSLPQEWLWCETWCGNSTKEAAKTIDLCNNPLTKEPKLEGARRIVAEWTGLDEEIFAFTRKVEEELEEGEEEAWSQTASAADAQAQVLPLEALEEAAEEAAALPEQAMETAGPDVAMQQEQTPPHDVTEL